MSNLILQEPPDRIRYSSKRSGPYESCLSDKQAAGVPSPQIYGLFRHRSLRMTNNAQPYRPLVRSDQGGPETLPHSDALYLLLD